MTKIEKLLTLLHDRIGLLREIDFAVPGCHEKWVALDDLLRSCEMDLRKFGPESLLDEE